MDFHFSNGLRFRPDRLNLQKPEKQFSGFFMVICESNLHANTVKYNFLVANKPNCIRKFIREVWVLH